MALTLLRATGMLSRLGMTTRPFPAGPLVPVEGPQLLGPRRGSATQSSAVTTSATPYRAADDVLPATRDSGVIGRRQAARTRLCSHRPRCPGLVPPAPTPVALELRVFNPGPDPDGGWRCSAARGGWSTYEGGRSSPFEGRFTLGDFAIATARLDGD